MIKLFASDLDGTLLNAFHQTDATILKAVREVIASGAHFAIATGRTAASGRDQGFEDVPIDIVASNGSIIREGDGRLLAAFPIDSMEIEELLRTFPGICFDCAAPDGTFITGSREQRQATFRRDGIVRRIAMRGMRRQREADPTLHFDQGLGDVLAHRICKVNCRVPDAGLARELEAYLADRSGTLVNAPFNPVMFEISRADVNKGSSIAWLARHYGYAEDEVAVYGDGGNDLVMLERFKHAYATLNGSDDAKRAAGAVIGPCYLHAVPHHMQRTLRAERGRIIID